MSGEGKKKTAVVLSGGGAYGAYEIGILKALFHGESAATNFIPLEPDIYTGTSVGAFNATILAMNGHQPAAFAIEELENIWLNYIAGDQETCGNGVFKFRGNPADLFNPYCYTSDPATPILQFTADTIFYAQTLFTRSLSFALLQGDISSRALQFVDLSAVISTDPFRITLDRFIDPEELINSDKCLRVVATNWNDGEAKVFENQDICRVWGRDVVRASAAIPGIFPVVTVEDIPYVDGGVVMNSPLHPAIRADAEIIHIIYLDPDVRNIPTRRLTNTLDTIDRVYAIMQADKTNADIKYAKAINEGLTVLENLIQFEAEADITHKDTLAFIRAAGLIQKRLKAGGSYKKLEIHRYHPQYELGGGLGILNFNKDIISNLIERGFNDAAYHNCKINQCILPGENDAA